MQQYTHENVRSIPHLPIYCDRYEDYRQFSPRHWHDHIEIIYVVSGSLQVICGENEYTLQENEFFGQHSLVLKVVGSKLCSMRADHS